MKKNKTLGKYYNQSLKENDAGVERSMRLKHVYTKMVSWCCADSTDLG